MSSNYSLHSIPVYWLLALYPHMYSQQLFKKSANGNRNNANPRGTSTLEHYRKVCPKEIYARAERAEACHVNSMENAPFFIGAILAGNFAGLESSTMNAVAGAYIGLRVLYSVLYVNTEENRKSYVRSGIWFGGVLVLMGTFVQAGRKMNAGLEL